MTAARGNGKEPCLTVLAGMEDGLCWEEQELDDGDGEDDGP